MWPAPIDHVFILCDPVKEPDRAKYLNEWLASNRIPSTSYTLGLTCYGSDLTAEDAWRVYNPWVDRGPVERQRNFNSYNLKMGEISLCINWATAAAAAIKGSYGCVMFLESDVIFSDGFLTKLGAALGAFESRDEWDFLSLSEGPNLRPPRAAGEANKPAWFKAPDYFHTRTTDAMIFRVGMLRKILGSFFPFAEVLDWELNYQLTLHGSRSFWLDPPIIRQGSGREYATTL
jgi:hypothetical protein